jgi:hypothetical protein
MTFVTGKYLRDPRDAVVALRLLVLAGLAMLGLGERPAYPNPFWFTLIVYGVTNLGYMASRLGVFLSARVQRAVFVFDVLVVSVLIVLRVQHARIHHGVLHAVLLGIDRACWPAERRRRVRLHRGVAVGADQTLLTFQILSQFAFFFVVSLFASSPERRDPARTEEERVRLRPPSPTARDLSRSEENTPGSPPRTASPPRDPAAGIARHPQPVAALKAALEEGAVAPRRARRRAGPQAPRRPGSCSAPRWTPRAADPAPARPRPHGRRRATPAEHTPCLRAPSKSAARLLRHTAREAAAASSPLRDAAPPSRPRAAPRVLLNLGSNALDDGGPRGHPHVHRRGRPARQVVFMIETGVRMTGSTATKALHGFFDEGRRQEHRAGAAPGARDRGGARRPPRARILARPGHQVPHRVAGGRPPRPGRPRT